MLVTRQQVINVESKLDELEFIESQITKTVGEIPDFRTDMQDVPTYTIEVNDNKYSLTEQSLNQWLGIGGFAIRSFKDASRVIIKEVTPQEKLTAGIFMLNHIEKYADKDRYKMQFYDNKNISVNNPNHPNLDGVRLFRELFNQFSMIGLTPMVYDLSFDPITGRQSLEVLFEENVQKANIRKNDSMATGIKITNSITGHAHFMVQLFAMQLVCTNGMIAPVRIDGLKVLHRSKWDMLGKISKWVSKITGRYTSYIDFNDEFYSSLVNGIVALAQKNSRVIRTALEHSMTVPLKDTPRKELEALGKKHALITKSDVDHMVNIYYSDSTIDRDNPSLLNIVQTVTRHANSIESPVKREELQELAYVIATN